MTTDGGYGPVIRAIDAGHVHSDTLGVCAKDAEAWPCRVIKAARKAQDGYARGLQRTADMRLGRLDIPPAPGR